MNKYAETIKEMLISRIVEMEKSPELFVKNPGIDFTRKRKLPFKAVMLLLITMGGGSIGKELLQAYGFDPNTPTTPAFIQQRDKILPEALAFLLHDFTYACPHIKTFQSYRLLAVDGSNLNLPVNPCDHETHLRSSKVGNGYSLLHLNAMYDLCSALYVDACVQLPRQANEIDALIRMVNRSHIQDNVILIADRYFESYNVFAHIERKGWNYVIRAKDLVSNTGILSGLDLPSDGEFDVPIHRILTRKQTKKTKAQPQLYKFLSVNSTFDFIHSHSDQDYPISFRVVRFKLPDGTYESIITNLPQSHFSAQQIKKLYHMRWGIETSFRHLKYSIGLSNFHAKKREYILQEIFARIIMYNFSAMIVLHTILARSETQYTYQVNFTVAILICRHFLQLRPNAPPPDVEAVISRNTLPLRPGRRASREIRRQSAVSFNYRVS